MKYVLSITTPQYSKGEYIEVPELDEKTVEKAVRCLIPDDAISFDAGGAPTKLKFHYTKGMTTGILYNTAPPVQIHFNIQPVLQINGEEVLGGVEIPVQMTFYGIRSSKDGKWLRAKGYSGSGDNWVDDIKNSKIYGKIGPARSQVTFWANKHPSYGVPELVELIVEKGIVVNEQSRVEKAKKKKQQEILNRKVRQQKYEIEQATKKLIDAKANLIKLKKSGQ